MNERQKKIILGILEVLNATDGALIGEALLHAECSLMVAPNPTLAEFLDALGFADRNGWVTGIVGKFGGKKKWNLSDAGQAAWLEMQRE